MLRSASMRAQILTFLLFFSFSPLLLYGGTCSNQILVEEDKLCHEKDFDLDLGKAIACLNKYAKHILRKDGALDCQWKKEMEAFLHSYGMERQSYFSETHPPYTPLTEAFRIFIPEEETDRGWCIGPFSRSSLFQIRVKQLQEQIKSIAFFLKEYHVRALGQNTSKLFAIREVELCDYNRVPIMHYELGKLSFDIKPQKESTTEPPPNENNGFHLYDSETIWELWNKAQHYKLDLTSPEEEETWYFFKIEFNLFPKSVEKIASKLEYLKSLPLSQQTNYMLYKTWGILNPTGRFRTLIRVKLWEKGLKKSEDISAMEEKGQDIVDYILSSTHSLDTEKLLKEFQSLSEEKKEKLKSLLVEKLASPGDQARYIQCSISQSMKQQKAEENTTINRDLDGIIVVLNAHFIDVNASLSNFFQRNDCVDLNKYKLPSSSSSEEEQIRSINHKVRGAVIVDTFDQVQVNLSIAPKIADEIPLELIVFIESLHEVQEN